MLWERSFGGNGRENVCEIDLDLDKIFTSLSMLKIFMLIR
jgi:hypothetical protein